MRLVREFTRTERAAAGGMVLYVIFLLAFAYLQAAPDQGWWPW